MLVLLVFAERHALGHRHELNLATGWSPVPSGATLRRLSFGYDRVAADIMWIKGLQYYGKQRLARAPMPRLPEYIETTVALDPHFIAPYIFGGLVLAQDMGEPEMAIDLLLRGIAANPRSWALPFELGFLLYLDLDQPRRAGKYFQLAATREGCPEMAQRFAAWAYAKGGSRADVRKVCEEIVRLSEDPNMARFAAQALGRIQIEEDLETLDAGVRVFRDREGRWPSDLETLVNSGDVETIPCEPEGGFYLYRPETGEVASSSQVQLALDRHFKELEDALARYKASWGGLPPELETLVERGFLAELKTIFGFRFAYDPDTGRLWAVDLWRT
jgi:hypothetical protein